MDFYLGTDQPNWLGKIDVPMMVSRRRMPKRKYPRAIAPWILDSGGFSELNLHGTWILGAKEYASLVRHYDAEIGRMAFAAPQDWMCEPFMLKKTGLTIAEHQRLTTDNYLALADNPKVFPVLQGWTVGDYLRHIEGYDKAGVPLDSAPLVGLGSVCRRQHTPEVHSIIKRLSGEGLRLHAFGVKTQGLAACRELLASADSMAWSFRGRFIVGRHGMKPRSCAHCIHHALDWRNRIVGDDKCLSTQLALLVEKDEEQ